MKEKEWEGDSESAGRCSRKRTGIINTLFPIAPLKAETKEMGNHNNIYVHYFSLAAKEKKWMGNRNKAATSGKYLMTNRITPRNGVGSTENKKKKEKVKNYYPRPKPMLAPCERIFPRRWGTNSSERGLDYFLAAFGTNEIRRITRPMYNKLRGRTTETAPREMMRTERNGHGVEISTRDRREFN